MEFRENGTVVTENQGSPKSEARYRMPDPKHVEFLLPDRDVIVVSWEVLSVDKSTMSIKRPGADHETLTRLKQ
jgi:hypothetical protein